MRGTLRGRDSSFDQLRARSRKTAEQPGNVDTSNVHTVLIHFSSRGRDHKRRRPTLHSKVLRNTSLMTTGIELLKCQDVAIRRVARVQYRLSVTLTTEKRAMMCRIVNKPSRSRVACCRKICRDSVSAFGSLRLQLDSHLDVIHQVIHSFGSSYAGCQQHFGTLSTQLAS